MTAIPLAFYLFLESLNNIESASAGGDNYSTREAMLVAATGTLIGSLFGSPFPTLIYIGHPGWKSVGARVGYSWATGVGILLLGTLGILGVVLTIIPIVAILPILIYIGLLITSQAFNASPARHAPAVAIALIPWIANFAQLQIDNSLNAAGTYSRGTDHRQARGSRSRLRRNAQPRGGRHSRGNDPSRHPRLHHRSTLVVGRRMGRVRSGNVVLRVHSCR